MSKRTIATRLLPDDYFIFRALARRNGIPTARLLRNLIKRYIANEKRKAGIIEIEECDYDGYVCSDNCSEIPPQE